MDNPSQSNDLTKAKIKVSTKIIIVAGLIVALAFGASPFLKNRFMCIVQGLFGYGYQYDGCEYGEPRPSITVISPNDGEVWEIGKTYDIKYKNTTKKDVGIELMKGDNLVGLLTYSETPLQTSFNIKVPEQWQIGYDYKIRIGVGDIVDLSDKSFSVVAAAPPVTPVGSNSAKNRASAWATAAIIMPELIICADDGGIGVAEKIPTTNLYICATDTTGANAFSGHTTTWPTLGNTGGWSYAIPTGNINGTTDGTGATDAYRYTLIKAGEVTITCNLFYGKCQ